MSVAKRRVFRKGQSVWVTIHPTTDQRKRILAGERMIIPCGYSGVISETDWPFVTVISTIDGSVNYELRGNVTHY